LYRLRAHGFRNAWRFCGRRINRWRKLPLRCNLCGEQSSRFVPLLEFERGLGEDLTTHGFPLAALAEFETLNVENYACPWCEASDRERLGTLFIEHALRESPQRLLRLLDIAPSSALQRYLRGTGRFVYRSADLFRPGVDDRVDVQDMACYADGAFDAVLCSHVLEHVPDDRRAMRELYRILAPGGWALLMVPIRVTQSTTDEDPALEDPGERIRRFAQRDHVRTYARADYLTRLRDTGGVVRQWTAADFGKECFRRHGILDGSVLYVLSKAS
jgi:SAM-dependent methyltransferase